jgi:hypothetical protein
MSTYQGCLHCKYYSVCRLTKGVCIVSITVCRLTKDVCIVSITVYVDLPRRLDSSLLDESILYNS